MSAIDETAARWVARQAADDWSGDQQQALDQWLGADTRHMGAYFRAQAAWTMLDRASVMGAGSNVAGGQPLPYEPAQHPAVTKPPCSISRRKAVLGIGSLGGIAASVAAGLLVNLALKDRMALATEVGELRKLPLKDKSMANVNTDSRIEVAMLPESREVKLVRGEAWFEVAKDTQRPFIVIAGSVRARAVGTAFSVRRFDEGADILVTEGVVEVWNTERPEMPPVRVGAGNRTYVAFVEPARNAEFQPGAIDRALAWREGQIALDNDTLDQAASEFNRYNMQKIIIADPKLKNARLVGWFRADQPETFARSVHEALNVGVVVSPDRIVIGG